VAACLPVYRTYIRPGSISRTTEAPLSEADVRHIHSAVEAAKTNRPDLDPRLLDFFANILLMGVRGDVEDDLVERFQQFSGPVMAKGVEDTTFYLYNRFISLNEVGGSPGHFGVSVEAFHRASQETQQRWPQAMLTTSTHDTKRSEDVRARLNVLSEIPREWIEAVQGWAEMNEPYRTEVPGGPSIRPLEERSEYWPDRNTEYLLYQTLAGAWPISTGRVQQYMEKACREAKAYTTWTEPNQPYEEAVASFIRQILADERFTASLEAFVQRILEPGRINSLAQALVKLTAPGVPDIYQGTELWNLTLVDPDNRQPVDYNLRQRLLDTLSQGVSPEEIWTRAEEGLPKLWVTRQALDLRRRRPELFGASGSYQPLVVDSPGEQPLALAYIRGGEAAVIVPRLPARGRPCWDQAQVELPPGHWRSLLTGERFSGGQVTLADLLGRFPTALLEKENA
jgi:(1->4)-alpha-D-glucan 1-alpha-D-glucosylmutase